MHTYEGFWSSFDSISSKVTIFATLGCLRTRDDSRERLLSFGVRSGRRVQERQDWDALMGQNPFSIGLGPKVELHAPVGIPLHSVGYFCKARKLSWQAGVARLEKFPCLPFSGPA